MVREAGAREVSSTKGPFSEEKDKDRDPYADKDPYALRSAGIFDARRRLLRLAPAYTPTLAAAAALLVLGILIGRELAAWGRPRDAYGPGISSQLCSAALKPVDSGPSEGHAALQTHREALARARPGSGAERAAREVAAIQGGLWNPGARPRHSTFACTGRKWEDDYLHHACRFHDVCLNHTTLEVQFYVDPGEVNVPLFFHYLNGQPHYKFPEDFVMTGHVHILPYVPWAPKVVRGRIPPGTTYHAAPVAVLHSLNDFVGSFRHVLFDLVLPVFNLMQLFRAYAPDFLLLEAAHQGHDPTVAKFLVKPADDARSLLRLVTSRRAQTRAEVAAAAGGRGGGVTCFHTLLAGAGHLQASEARVRTGAFWAAAVTNLGIEVPEDQARPLVTVLTKRGRRSIENAGEIAVDLRGRFGAIADVELVDGSALSTVSIRKRMEALVRTSVLVTPCGSLGALALLLPPGATAVVMNYYHATTGANVALDDAAFWNVDHVTMVYFPVGPEDYEGTTDRPGCQKKQGDPQFEEEGALVNCNLRIADMKRMRHVVGPALRRWVAQRA